MQLVVVVVVVIVVVVVVVVLVVVVVVVIIIYYTHRRHTSMLPAGFDPQSQRAGERSQTYALYSATTRGSTIKHYITKM